MAIETGAKLPYTEFLIMGENGPQPVDGAAIFAGKKVVLFGLPGAYTGVCTTAHVPSFIRTADAFREKGVDGIYCVTVNDPFVTGAWAKETGTDDAGITILADASALFTDEIGMAFTAPPAGLYARSKRYSMLVEDGVVTQFNLEENGGECSISAGEELLSQI